MTSLMPRQILHPQLRTWEVAGHARLCCCETSLKIIAFICVCLCWGFTAVWPLLWPCWMAFHRLWGAWAPGAVPPGCTGSVVGAHGLVAPSHVRSSQSRIEAVSLPAGAARHVLMVRLLSQRVRVCCLEGDLEDLVV